jgi:hypothetical protein
MRRLGEPLRKRRSKVRVKGAIHIHSRLSHDGTLTVGELARFYCRKGYHFLAMSEHSEDMDESKTDELERACAENSSKEFCMIPGIEFSCKGGIHIPALGVVEMIPTQDPIAITDEIHRLHGFAILAHPRRIKWKCPEEVLRVVDAVEIWNVGYDGKYLPSSQAIRAFRKMRRINPDLLAVASHDFHQTGSFYDVALEMDLGKLDPAGILAAIRGGRFEVRSKFFRTDSHAHMTLARSTSLGLFSFHLHALRRVRRFFLRWSS